MLGFFLCSIQILSLHNLFFSLSLSLHRGTSGIDIDLRRVDIDQCPQMKNSGAQQPLNIFAGTDKCKQKTTEVIFSNFKIEIY